MDHNSLEQQDSKRRKTMPMMVFFKDARSVFKMDELGKEILQIAVPAALALAADPVASLIDTAFIGRIGAVELAAVGVAIAVFNQASKVTIYPLVSITTSFVAEEDTIGRANNILTAKVDDSKCEETKEVALEEGRVVEISATPTPSDDSTTICEVGACSASDQNIDKCSIGAKTKKEKRHIPSASTAIVVGFILGVIQAILLVLGAKLLLGFMGVKSGSPMLSPAIKYLKLRSLGSPAILLSLAMQGVFRGFKDTTTPLYATVVGDATNIILDPILIFVCKLGVSGAAIAHVISQYLMTLILLLQLMKQVDLLPPSFKSLQFNRFLKNGLPLLGRVIAVTFCVTLAASLAARLGTVPMAAFQICLQVWLTSSLLADGLAVAGQAILAGAFAENNYDRATSAAARVLQMSVVLGMGLAVVVGLGLQFGSVVFTKDVNVVHLISIGVPFVAATQPINSIAFVFDGVNYGASDFSYAAYSMVVVAGISVGSLFLLSKSNGFVGIWVALTIYMLLRAFAGIWRMGSGSGPWRFLKGKTYF